MEYCQGGGGGGGTKVQCDGQNSQIILPWQNIC